MCGSSKSKIIKDNLRDSNQHKVVKCSSCGQVQIYPRPSIIEDKKYYDKDSQAIDTFKSIDMNSIKERSTIESRRRLAAFQNKLKRTDDMLEVGCGYGFFIKYMEMHGYSIQGIEISDIRREYGTTNLGCKIFNVNLINEDLPKSFYEKYDVIFLLHVLEHISEPEEFLKKIRKMLKKDGLLIIEVPNFDDHMLNISETYYDFYFQRAHITYFNKESLEKLLKTSGWLIYEFKGIQRYDLYNALNWIIKGKPELENRKLDTLEWVEDFYRERLVTELSCDTLIAYCK